MNNYLTIIGYEYKKILKRSSTWIVISFALVTILISCFADISGNVYVEGKPVYTHYERMKTDRAYARELAGRKVDESLIDEMREAYLHVPDVPLYSATEEYQTYARPYSAIYYLVSKVANEIQVNTGTRLELFDLDGAKYYDLRKEALRNKLQAENLTEIEIKSHLQMDKQVKIPFVFDYTDGYGSIMSGIYTMGIILLLTLTICLAPMFANEYTVKTDQLILTTKWGKNKVIVTKLFTGMSFGFIITCVFLLVKIIPTLTIYGFDGWNAPIQLMNVLTTYPFNVMEGLLIMCGMTFAAAMLIVSLSLFLSARLKSSFAVMVVISTFIILIIFVNIPQQYRFLYQFVNMLPTNILSEKGAFTDCLVVVFGNCIPAYQTVPIIYVVVISIFLVLGYRAFKNHQIG